MNESAYAFRQIVDSARYGYDGLDLKNRRESVDFSLWVWA